MKLNIGKLIVLGAVVAALLSLSAVARADGVIYGKVWENAIAFNSPLPTSAPSGTPTATFMVTGPSQIFNFYSDTDNSLADFVTRGGTNGNIFTRLTGSLSDGNCAAADRLATCGLNNDIVEFTGTAYLAAGQYHITKDDAVFFKLAGFPDLDGTNNTAAETLNFTVGTSGAYNFDMLYSEVNGPPAVLESDITVTPEPGGLLLLGSGMLVAAFVLRRQIMA